MVWLIKLYSKNKLLQICNRDGIICDEPESIESEIYNYVENNSRKWSR